MRPVPQCRLASSRSALLAVLVVTLVACGGGGENASSSVSASQTASPAPVAMGAATLSWVSPIENMDGSALLNLSGFKIYYGQDANSLIRTISISNASISTYVIDSLAAGTWYFGVSAINSEGIESPLSNIASKTIG